MGPRPNSPPRHLLRRGLLALAGLWKRAGRGRRDEDRERSRAGEPPRPPPLAAPAPSRAASRRGGALPHLICYRETIVASQFLLPKEATMSTISPGTRLELVTAVADRYRQSTAAEKRLILDEFVALAPVICCAARAVPAPRDRHGQRQRVPQRGVGGLLRRPVPWISWWRDSRAPPGRPMAPPSGPYARERWRAYLRYLRRLPEGPRDRLGRRWPSTWDAGGTPRMTGKTASSAGRCTRRAVRSVWRATPGPSPQSARARELLSVAVGTGG